MLPAILVVKIAGGQKCKAVCITSIAEQDEFLYPDSLKGSDKVRYEKKFFCFYNAADKENIPWEMLDPYQLGSEAWVDDPSLWPKVEFLISVIGFCSSPIHKFVAWLSMRFDIDS